MSLACNNFVKRFRYVHLAHKKSAQICTLRALRNSLFYAVDAFTVETGAGFAIASESRKQQRSALIPTISKMD